MKNFKLADTRAGWAVFALASISYLLTIEPTASYWDCGEFICTAFRQEVGHPPGAPLFMILGRFFSLFAFGDVTKVAAMINAMSALASGFTVLFLYWSISHIARRIVCRDDEEPSSYQAISIIGSGVVGSLAFAYTDTFWFSAVEGEVYAMSSLFTAAVFWCILKWESVSSEKYSNRWLILICYLMGLSIGVHLLNLLVIPAIVLVYYFKKYRVTPRGTLLALGLSLVILAAVLYGIIPGVVYVASRFELVFTNGMGAPYNTGTIVYALLGVGALGYGLYYSFTKRKAVLNTVLLGIAVIILGYSCFAMIVIRSMANPPMDENNPDNVFALQSYLNREQYGDRPLVTGPYFNSEPSGVEVGSPTYIQRNDRYEIVDYKTSHTYESDQTTLFPRMYSPDPSHVRGYKFWADLANTELRPSFGENLQFFFSYQVNYMYWRYFFWNFVGRQNDIQGHDNNLLSGNWISGVPLIDNARLGDQSLLPDTLKNNKGNNKYYFLPLLLGILGMAFMLRSGRRGVQYFWIVMLFFVLTGLAIVVYLNQTPYQPRERDYAYAGSFYAFAFYIGFAPALLCSLVDRYLNRNAKAAMAAVALCVLGGPVILASENWDDHDRSGRYTCRDFARNYLESCAPNAILFTNGDNDTFPLWYAQEVEGIRTDVRVVNLAYINTGWYINQMRKKAYLSDPLPLSIPSDKLVDGSRDITYINDMPSMLYGAKFDANKDKYSAPASALHDRVVSMLAASGLKSVLPSDYDAIVIKRKLEGNVPAIASLLNSLGQQPDKFGVDAAMTSSLKAEADALLKLVCSEPLPLEAAVDFIASDEPSTKVSNGGESYDFVPSSTYSLKVDKAKVLANGTVSAADSARIVDRLEWKHPRGYIRKGELAVMDILAHNNWERPVYFAITVGSDAYMNLDQYFRLDGLAYRLVPVKTSPKAGDRGYVDTDLLYDNYVNKFTWGGINNPKVYLDENNLRMLMNVKSGFSRLATELASKGDNDRAKAVIDKCYHEMPLDIVAPGYYDIFIADLCYSIGDGATADSIMRKLADINEQSLRYMVTLDDDQKSLVEDDYYRALAMSHEQVRILRRQASGNRELEKELASRFADVLKSVPLLMQFDQAGASADFMTIYQNLSDFDKQIIQIYLYLTDETLQ